MDTGQVEWTLEKLLSYVHCVGDKSLKILVYKIMVTREDYSSNAECW